MMPPIRKVMSRMMGTACQATRSNWLTVEVNRYSRGRAMTRSAAIPTAPSMSTNSRQVAAEAGAGLADGGQRADNSVLLGRRLCRLAVDAVHLLEQAAIVLRHADDHRLAAGRAPGAGEPLQQPGAERVELAHPRHVDRDALRLRRVAGRAVDQRLQLAGIRRGPRAGRRELQPLAVQLTFEQDSTIGMAPPAPFKALA